MSGNDAWPELPYPAWKETCETLHLWTQIVGKVRLALTPWLNHSWQVPLYVTARGLSTSPIYAGNRAFEITFDFLEHALALSTSDGEQMKIALAPRSVAAFYESVMQALRDLAIVLEIDDFPAEIPGAIRFSRDQRHAAYDRDFAQRFWRVLLQADRVFKLFRTSFLGKASPVQFFWGSFDLAVTRFSGRRAPPHPGGAPGLSDAVMREAYSHEVSSAGFWPGGGGINYAAFYSYAYPEPANFRTWAVEPETAGFNETLGEFILPYDAVRTARDSDATLLAFLNSTYEAAARNANWDRALECSPGAPGVPRQTP